MTIWAIALATLVLAACSTAQAEGPNTVYMPMGIRNAVVFPTSTVTPTATPTPRPTAISTGLAVISKSTYSYPSDTSGDVYIVARVHNYGPPTRYGVGVTMTFYNAANQIVGSTTGSTYLSMLRAGEFSHVRTSARPQAGWTSYTVNVTSSTTTSFYTYRHDGLDVSGLNTYRVLRYRNESSVYVVGQVTNNTGKTLKGPVILDASIYAPDGTIVDAGSTYPWSFNDVAPGASTSFSVSFYDENNRIPTEYTYTARAEGHE